MTYYDPILYGIGILYALWIFYLASMNLKRAKDANTLPFGAVIFGYPVVIVGVLMDCFVNLTICTVIFLEWPRELLVTGRVSRLEATGTGWRQSTAKWFCDNLLNAFDPSGKHCN
jgi:hypothetical protein